MGGACLGHPCIREALCAIWLLSLLIWSFWVFPSFCDSVPVPLLRPVALPFRQHLPSGQRHNTARPCFRLPREGCAMRTVFGAGLEFGVLRGSPRVDIENWQGLQRSAPPQAFASTRASKAASVSPSEYSTRSQTLPFKTDAYAGLLRSTSPSRQNNCL
jgi:hypothetical protein